MGGRCGPIPAVWNTNPNNYTYTNSDADSHVYTFCTAYSDGKASSDAAATVLARKVASEG